MGSLTSDRKRGNEFSSLNYGGSVSNSRVSELHVSKKSRISPSMNQTADRSNRFATILKFFQYPVSKTVFKREPHAPVRRHRGGFSVNLGNIVSKVSSKDNFTVKMGNLFSRRYDGAKGSAFNTFMLTEEDKEVTEESKKEEGLQEISEDSSIEEVEILEDKRDQKWEESNGVVEDSRKFNGMVVDKDSRPSSSSAVTNISDGNLKVETTENLLESLLLSAESGVPQESVHKKLLYIAERRNEKLKSLKFEIEYAEKQRQLQQLLRPQKKEDAVEDVTAEAFKPLTEEEETQVNRALFHSRGKEPLVTHKNSNISITGEVLRCLRPGAWLNDEVINLYLELLKERERREPQKFLKCHFFSTFFFKKLVSGRGGYNYQAVRRWTSQKKLGYCIFDCDKIFVPIHKEIHWCLAVINKKDTKFQYLDSLGGVDCDVMEVLSRYIVDEVKDKSNREINVSSWQQEFVADLPEQENGFDCGVFMIKYADFYSRDIGLCFNQTHMPYFRLRTAKEILMLKAE